MNREKLDEEITKLNEAQFNRNAYSLLLDQMMSECKKAKQKLDRSENIDEILYDVSYSAANLIRFAMQLQNSEK